WMHNIPDNNFLSGLILLATSVAGRFTEDFYRLLAKENPQENLIVSPLSVEIAMTMAYMGAEGKTADELQTVLKLPKDKKQVTRKYKELISELQRREKDVILELANRIYINNNYSLVPEYNEVMRDSFQAEAVPISLSNPNKAADIVNQWVSDQTHGKIRSIVSEMDMNSGLRTLLLNAIYFKGQWEKQFKEEFTWENSFHVSNTEEISVQMMGQTNSFKAAYLLDLDAKVIELPYRNSSLSMLIFLPNKIDGLSQLEDKIIGFSRRLYEQDVSIRLPKFKIEFEEDLTDILQKLGIQDAFGSGANFDGLVLGSSTYIEQVFHKAFVEVNEGGAEAAAVTQIRMMQQSQIPRVMDFICDHPFAYIIRDGETVLFQGHVIKP
ncbi:hypothetical protein KR032_005550, partial [Drosophila birchii]